MNVLVTGSSGPIGSAIVDRLSQKHTVLGFDRVHGTYTTHIGNICTQSDVGRYLERVDAVIHVAALHAPHVATQSEDDFWTINVSGTNVLLEAAKAAGVKRFVFTSTTSVYGNALEDADQAVWIDETVIPQPRDIYDVTKLEAEQLVTSASSDTFLTAILRMSRCFPEPAHLMAAYRLYRGVDRRDVAAAHELAMAKAGDTAQVFVISAQSPFKKDDLAMLKTDAPLVMEARVPGIGSMFRDKNWPSPASIDRVYSIDKARQCLGYEPQWNFTQFDEQTSDPRPL